MPERRDTPATPLACIVKEPEDLDGKVHARLAVCLVFPRVDVPHLNILQLGLPQG